MTVLSDGITLGLVALGWETPGVKQVFYGLMLLAVVAFLPNGIWPAIARKLKL
jgi:branched-chain amino acid transport system permease protein